MSRTLYLHVGYPKTGSTALQRHIFPQLRECGFFYAGYSEDLEHETAGEFIKLVHTGQRSVGVSRRLARDGLISAESVLFDCMCHFDDSGRFRPQPVDGLGGRVLAAASAYGAAEARVVIVLRRQDELSHSLYAEGYTHYFSRVRGLRSYQQYAGRIVAGGSLAAAYDYASLVSDFMTTFGREQVLVLFYEELVADTRGFLEELSAFVGCQLPDSLPAENVRLVGGGARATETASLRDELSALKRLLAPRLTLGIDRYLRFLRSIPVRRSILIARRPDLERQVLESFRDSNLRLAQLLDRDLSGMGYYT